VNTTIHRVGYEGPEVVLLHSLALDHTLWRELAATLSNDFRLFLFDLPGHGASRNIAVESIEDMSDLVAEALRDALAGPAVVVGLSLGGSVAQAVAARNPGLVRALVLADTTAWYGASAPRAWAERADRASAEGLASLADFQLTRWFTAEYRRTHPETCVQLLSTFRANDLDRYRDTCRAMGAMDLRSELGRISAPTTVLVGEQDEATPPAMARGLRDGIEGATLRVIPDCRHLSAVERPEVLTAVIRQLTSQHADAVE
jgi:3-oxoadipate enol-lactonase